MAGHADEDAMVTSNQPVASAGATRELSGILSSEAKWDATLADLSAAAASTSPGSSSSGASALAPGERITALRIMHNDDSRAVAVARALVGNCTVQSLEIGTLGAAGAAALAEALAATPSLASLTLPAIDSDAAAAALAAGLSARSVPLAAVSIGGLGPRGVEALGSALLAAGPRLGLCRLELSGCGVDLAAAHALAQGLAAQAGFVELVLKAPREEGGMVGATAAGSGGGSGPHCITNSSGSSSSAEGQSEPPLAALLGSPLLRRHPALSSVSLSGARVGPATAAALGNLLNGPGDANNHSVTSGKTIDQSSLQSPLSAAMRLLLSDCPLGDDGAALLAAAAASTAPTSSTTTRAVALEFERCGLGASAAAAIGAVARASPRLEVLRISGDEIGPLGAEALAEALAGHPGLLELSLCSAGIEAGGDAIAALLAHPACTLTTLTLPGNRLPDATAAAIAAGLSTNATLSRLDLSSNWIGDVGGTTLAGPLASHPTLCALCLDGNRLRTAGVEALSDAALTNPRVLELGAATTRIVSNLVKTCAADVQRALQQRRARAAAGGASGAPTPPVSRESSRSSDRGEAPAAGSRGGSSGSLSPVNSGTMMAAAVTAPGRAVYMRMAFADDVSESPRAGKLPRRESGSSSDLTFLPSAGAVVAQALADAAAAVPGASPFGSSTQQAKPHLGGFGPGGSIVTPVTPPLMVCPVPVPRHGGAAALSGAGDAAALAALVAGGLLPPTPAACLCCGAPPCSACAAALRAGLSLQLLGPQPDSWGRSRSISLEGWAPRLPASPISPGSATDSLDRAPSLSLWHDAPSDGSGWCPMSPDAVAARISLERASLDGSGTLNGVGGGFGGGVSSSGGGSGRGLIVHTRGGTLIAHRSSSNAAGALPPSAAVSGETTLVPLAAATAASPVVAKQRPQAPVSSPHTAVAASAVHQVTARPSSRLGLANVGGWGDAGASCSSSVVDFPLLPSVGPAALL